MSIQLLPEEVASRIAAGEVVERPASVVKELVENSLDAGATRVEVETRDGGKALIRVRDNGSGIPAAEVPLAFRRHATSKLTTADDLERIATLGFRGEALASIASVSRVTCTTRSVHEETGIRVRLEGGALVAQAPLGRPPGTELLVEELFYNTPARRKFLHSERTERRHTDAFLTRYAIAYPQVAFRVVHDGTAVLSTPGNGAAREVLLAVYGMELGVSLLSIPPELTAGQPGRVTGFVGPTTVHRADRGYITLFINGRWIQDLRITYAIIQAYHTLLPVNRFPVAFVMVELPPEEVDVNVHPAKSEVRFRDADAIFRLVQRAVRATVMEMAPTTASWQPAPPSEPEAPVGAPEPSDLRARLAALQPRQFSLDEAPAEQASPSAAVHRPFILPADAGGAAFPTPPPAAPSRPVAAPAPSRPALPPLRVVGQIATMFIVAEGPEGMYLIDQHAAHERVLYEQMLAAWTQGQSAAQPLLEPESVTLPLDEAARLEALLPALHTLGMEIEPFGPGTFLVRALPAQLRNMPPRELLADLAASDGDRTPLQAGLEEQLVRRICKRAAIKAGQVLSIDEMATLVRALEQTLNPRTCPHGRPTVLQLSVEQLAQQFGRT